MSGPPDENGEILLAIFGLLADPDRSEEIDRAAIEWLLSETDGLSAFIEYYREQYGETHGDDPEAVSWDAYRNSTLRPALVMQFDVTGLVNRFHEIVGGIKRDREIDRATADDREVRAAEWPREFTVYAHSANDDEIAYERAEYAPAGDKTLDRALRGLGYEVELTYRVHEDAEVELIRAADVGGPGGVIDRASATIITCGCGDYDVAVTEYDRIVELDVLCPECNNHFGFGPAPDDDPEDMVR